MNGALPFDYWQGAVVKSKMTCIDAMYLLGGIVQNALKKDIVSSLLQ